MLLSALITYILYLFLLLCLLQWKVMAVMREHTCSSSSGRCSPCWHHTLSSSSSRVYFTHNKHWSICSTFISTWRFVGDISWHSYVIKSKPSFWADLYNTVRHTLPFLLISVRNIRFYNFENPSRSLGLFFMKVCYTKTVKTSKKKVRQSKVKLCKKKRKSLYAFR